MNIVLIGFMGSGKSTVARYLSARLGLSSIEMDELVYQKTATHNMHDLFAKGGELLLRETEIAVAKEIASKERLVISTGGGVVLNKIILDYFKQGGAKVIFLKTSFEEIVRRLEGDYPRPLFNQLESAKKLYDLRQPLYLGYADLVIETDSKTAKEVADGL